MLDINQSWLIKKSNVMNPYAQSLYNYSQEKCTAWRIYGETPLGRGTVIYEDYATGLHRILWTINVAAAFRQNSPMTSSFIVKQFASEISREYLTVNLAVLDGLPSYTVIFDVRNLAVHSVIPSFDDGIHPFIYELGDGWVLIGITIDGSVMGMGVGAGLVRHVLGGADATGNTSYTGQGKALCIAWKGFLHQEGLPHPMFQNEWDDIAGVREYGITDAVQIYLDEDFRERLGRVVTENRSTAGKRFLWRYGNYRTFKMEQIDVDLSDALKLNNWWRDRQELILFDGLTHKQYKVFLTGKKQPMQKKDNFYANRMKGTLDIEVTEDVFPD